MKKALILILTLLSATPILAQDVVTLNNGETVNGEIIHQDDRRVVIRTSKDVELTYFMPAVASYQYGENAADDSFWNWNRLTVDARVHLLPDSGVFDWGCSLSADYLLEHFGRHSSFSAGFYATRLSGPTYAHHYDSGYDPIYTHNYGGDSEWYYEGANTKSMFLARVTYNCDFGNRLSLHAGAMVGGSTYVYVSPYYGHSEFHDGSDLEVVPFISLRYFPGDHVGLNIEASAVSDSEPTFSLALGISYRF